MFCNVILPNFTEKWRLFHDFNSCVMDGPTDRPTDGRMDTPSYGDARTHLKSKLIYVKKSTNVVQAHFCSFIHLEMVSKMVEAIIFQISKKRARSIFSFFLYDFAPSFSFVIDFFCSFVTEVENKVPLCN